MFIYVCRKLCNMATSTTYMHRIIIQLADTYLSFRLHECVLIILTFVRKMIIFHVEHFIIHDRNLRKMVTFHSLNFSL